MQKPDVIHQRHFTLSSKAWMINSAFTLMLTKKLVYSHAVDNACYVWFRVIVNIHGCHTVSLKRVSGLGYKCLHCTLAYTNGFRAKLTWCGEFAFERGRKILFHFAQRICIKYIHWQTAPVVVESWAPRMMVQSGQTKITQFKTVLSLDGASGSGSLEWIQPFQLSNSMYNFASCLCNIETILTISWLNSI